MAPKNNTNALKHGFYSKQFRRQEIADLNLLLEAGAQATLVDEIAMLRVSIRRTLELADGIEDVETAIKWLGALGASATRIARLLQVQKKLSEAGQGSLDVITQALDAVTAEWGLK